MHLKAYSIQLRCVCDDGPAQDLNGCAWLLKCVADIVMAGKAVDRRSIAPDDNHLGTGEVHHGRNGDSTIRLAFRGGIQHDGVAIFEWGSGCTL